MLLKILLFLFFGSMAARAETLPATLRDGSTRFLSRSLGSACYTLDSVRHGLPCNPAAAGKDRHGHLAADFFIGAQTEYLKEAEDLLRGHNQDEAVTRLVARREAIDAEFSIEASFQAPKWGVAVEPYRLVALTRFENPALPMVDMVIAEEQSVKGQIASYLSENFYAGLQARYTHIRFIGQYFSVSEALAQGHEALFASQNVDLVYLEPGFLYAWEDQPWQPQVSVVLAHWGVSSQKTEQYPIQPQGLLGASVKPAVPLGLLELGVQCEVDAQMENVGDVFRGAMTYHLGILQAVLSASEKSRAVGFILSYKSFTNGLSYWDEYGNRSVFIQLGVTL